RAPRRCSATSSPSGCCVSRAQPEPGGCSGRVALLGVGAVRMLHRAPATRRRAGQTAHGTRVARDGHRRMAFIGFVIALMLFWHWKKRLRSSQRGALDWRSRRDDSRDPWAHWRTDWKEQWAEWNRHWAEQAQRYGDKHAEWHRKWAEKMERHVERDRRRQERRAARRYCRQVPEQPPTEEELLARARRRAAAETGFYVHVATYVGVIALLALINLMTT